MILSDQLIFSPDECKDFEGLQDYLTFKNPKWLKAKRMHQHWVMDKEPEEEVFMYTDGESFKVPRNIPPKFFFSKAYESLLDQTVAVPLKNKISFKGSLRDYQKEFFIAYDPFLYPDNVYEVSCGLGKTIMALYSIYRRKQRTVILAPTHKLIGQWYREASKFLKGVKIGISDKEVETSHLDYDILILSQDLARERNLGTEFFSTFGYSVWDEGHKFGSGGYLPLIENCPCKYRTLLTATFRRADGNDKLLKYHFGEKFTMKYKGEKASVYALSLSQFKYISACKIDLPSHKVESLRKLKCKTFKGGKYIGLSAPKIASLVKSPELETLQNRFSKNPNFSALASLSTSIHRRNLKVISFVNFLLSQDRNILILSKRKDVLISYEKYFKSRVKTYLVVSETNDHFSEEDMNKDARIILGIQQLTEYGFNVPRLDTVVYLHPITDTEQSIGRVLRFYEGKMPPLAISVLDNNPFLSRIFNKAVKEYVPYNGVFKGTFKQRELCQILEKKKELPS